MMKNKTIEIKKQFIKDLSNRSIDSISVISLCNELKITRQAFYYHYKDIYELVESILDDYTNDLFLQVNNNFYLSHVLEFLKDNFYFFNELLRGNLNDLVNKFICNLLLPVVKEKLVKLYNSNELSSKEESYILKYHTTALSILIIENLLGIFEDFNISNLLNRIEVFINNEILSLNIKYINYNRGKI